ncbi:iron complex transport system ATP-binding protein [Roseivivax marinus]|uniref:ABC transporter ATP-binding protein n=1 Tax=Roseivivax marinus TaxID=1379903 RepID=UPI0008D2D377|nr:ABC transporter ATP-binding protein [Roseivivax marinus]SEL95676.1 iron complex transport system ATP-binding protein [Roseivivax marinus]
MFELRDISKRHGGREVLGFDRLSLGHDGVTAILGQNGSGKSTLMSLLARQARPDTGEVRLGDAPIGVPGQRAFARQVAYLPQRLPAVPGLTVRELAGLGRFAWRGAFGRWDDTDRDAVTAGLRETGVAGFADALADDLSGGERQRAWIAMLLAQDAPLLLLDEPTAALDLAHAYEVMDLLRRTSRERDRQVIVVLHDVNLAARFADRILALRAGRVTFDGPPTAFLAPDTLRALYDIDMALIDGPSGPVAVVA